MNPKTATKEDILSEKYEVYQRWCESERRLSILRTNQGKPMPESESYLKWIRHVYINQGQIK